MANNLTRRARHNALRAAYLAIKAVKFIKMVEKTAALC